MPNQGGEGPHYDVIAVDFIKGTTFVFPRVGSASTGEEQDFYVKKFML